MTKIAALIKAIAETKGSAVLPPSGQPVVADEHRLPSDLVEFYSLCGGVRLFEDSAYPIRIVEPQGVVPANPEIVGLECPGDMTESWYIVARGGSEEAISIDCDPLRLGRCYDSFWDRHGVAGSCAIVALSFSELLTRLHNAGGGYWYWLVEDGSGYGDAYGPR